MFQVNDSIDVYANQGMREAVVLSVVGNKVLIEYQMPAGRTFLRVIDQDAELGEGGRYSTVSYSACPKKFINDMVANDMLWEGGFSGIPNRGERFDADRAAVQRQRIQSLIDAKVEV